MNGMFRKIYCMSSEGMSTACSEDHVQVRDCEQLVHKICER